MILKAPHVKAIKLILYYRPINIFCIFKVRGACGRAWLTPDFPHSLMGLDEPFFYHLDHFLWIFAVKPVALLDRLPEVVPGVLGRFFATVVIKHS